MSHYYLAIRNEKKELEHFDVPKEVYIYVKQLEAALKYENMYHGKDNLKETYPGRFEVGFRFE